MYISLHFLARLTSDSHLPEREDHSPRKDKARLRLHLEVDVLRQL
jgi:hypothetical protein